MINMDNWIILLLQIASSNAQSENLYQLIVLRYTQVTLSKVLIIITL